MLSRVFHLDINPGGNPAVTAELNAIFTRKGSGVGAGNPIAYSIMFARSGRLVAHDNATSLPSGVSLESYINYFRNSAFQDYLRALRTNKKALHDLHVDDALGIVVASSYRFRHWLMTVKNYDAEGVSQKGHISTVNTLILLSPLRNLQIDALEQVVEELDEACALAMNKFPDAVKAPAGS